MDTKSHPKGSIFRYVAPFMKAGNTVVSPGEGYIGQYRTV